MRGPASAGPFFFLAGMAPQACEASGKRIDSTASQ
jgi:hypothetical protein